MNATCKKFDRTLLPSAPQYFALIGHPLKGKGAWRVTKCIFHDDKIPSMSVRVETGGFVCHACGAKGGDILALHMRRTGLRFLDAAQDLGALR